MGIPKYTEDQIARAHDACFRWANDPDYSTVLAMQDLTAILVPVEMERLRCLQEDHFAIMEELRDWLEPEDGIEHAIKKMKAQIERMREALQGLFDYVYSQGLVGEPKHNDSRVNQAQSALERE